MLRIFCFYFAPGSVFNSLLSALVILLVGYFLMRQNHLAWYLVAAELLLGGNGNFLELFNISLRTWLLVTTSITWFLQNLANKTLLKNLTQQRYYLWPAVLLLITATLGSIHGWLNGHGANTFKDLLPYGYFFYFFPFKELVSKSEFKTFALSLLNGFVIGSFIFTFFTFILFNTGLELLQGGYYHWFRDIAGGKITDLGLNFYRVVLNEHLLLIPALLVFIIRIIKNSANKIDYILMFLLLSVLAINLTRIFVLALILCLLFILVSQKFSKKSLAWFVATPVLFFTIFTTTHLLATHFKSLGWELFGLRLQSIVSPGIEDSSLSRLLILPVIETKLNNHPILGWGLGDNFTVFSPVLKNNITTTQYDWGWLEIWVELGLIGLLAWIYLAYSLIKHLLKQYYLQSASAILAISIITITSPAIFHVLGVCLITYLFTLNSERA